MQISRTEQSPIVPRNPSTADWEEVYGDLVADGQAVLFAGPSTGSILKVLPSGEDEQNLISLVRDVVRIQAIGDKSQRLDQWLVNVQESSSDEGRKAALRSFVEEGGQWVPLEPVLRRALTDQRLSHPLRAFGFGIAAFGVTQEKWSGARDDVLRFLCERFTSERDPRLAMQYTLSLGGLFSYADDENHRSERVAIRQSLERCVAQRPTLTAGPDATADPGLEQQYRAFRARYLRNQ